MLQTAFGLELRCWRYWIYRDLWVSASHAALLHVTEVRHNLLVIEMRLTLFGSGTRRSSKLRVIREFMIEWDQPPTD